MSEIRALGSRVHLLLHPRFQNEFRVLFNDVLRCSVVERDFGTQYPFLFVPFADGSAFSVEFSGEVPEDPGFCATWIEFRVNDLEATLASLRGAGVEEFVHPASPHAYFRAPGGQVFRVLSLDYTGP